MARHINEYTPDTVVEDEFGDLLNGIQKQLDFFAFDAELRNFTRDDVSPENINEDYQYAFVEFGVQVVAKRPGADKGEAPVALIEASFQREENVGELEEPEPSICVKTKIRGEQLFSDVWETDCAKVATEISERFDEIMTKLNIAQ